MNDAIPDPRTSDILAPCPVCRIDRHIRRDAWMATIRFESEKTDHQREVEERDGKIEGFKCQNCKEKYPNVDWHRSYERQQFRAKGWTTERMSAP